MGFLNLPLAALIAIGFAAGLISTLLFRPRGSGCFWLSIFPIFAVILAGFEFNRIPQDDLNSTASLVIVFAGIWVGVGLVGGYLAGITATQRRKDDSDVE